MGVNYRASSWSTSDMAWKWHQNVVAPIDADQFYHRSVLKLQGVPFVSRFAAAIYDPKIFQVMRSRPAIRFAAIDGWIRMMWRKDGLPRWVREAIAVTVSLSNSCDY